MVKIIIPTYKRYDYLSSLLRDITHQTYKDYEVLVCSDGPDMKVFEITLDFNSRFPQTFSYLHTDKTVGDWGISPRKKGLSETNDADLVVFIDDDNSISRLYLETLCKGFEEYPEIDLSFVQVYLADPEINGERIVPISNVPKDQYYSYGYVDPLCMMMRSRLAKKHIHIWGTERDQDYPFIIACMCDSRYLFTPKLLAVHR